MKGGMLALIFFQLFVFGCTSNVSLKEHPHGKSPLPDYDYTLSAEDMKGTLGFVAVVGTILAVIVYFNKNCCIRRYFCPCCNKKN